MMRLLAWLMTLALLPAPVLAADYYFDCNAANNSGAGTSPATAKQNWSGFSLSGLNGANDTVNLNRGCSWSNLSLNFGGPTTTAANPLRVRAYGSGAKPIVAMSDGTTGMNLEGNAFIVENIRFTDSSGQNTAGIQVLAGKTRFEMDGVEISGFYTGLDLRTGTDGTLSDRCIVRNAVIEQNRGFGVNGGCNNMLIEDSTVRENNTVSPSGFLHAFYITSPYAVMSNLLVRRNQLLRNSTAAGQCNGGNFTIHGSLVDMVFEDNVIDTEATDVTFNCYGVSLTPGYNVEFGPEPEGCNRCIIRRNRIVNVGVGIGGNAVLNSVIEANQVVNTLSTVASGITPYGFLIPNGAYDGGGTTPNHDQRNVNNRLVSNTFDFSTAGAVGIVINKWEGDIDAGDAWFGVGSVIASNAIRLRSTGYCFAVPTPDGSNFTVTSGDRNACFGGTGVNNGDASVSAFQTRTGFSNTVSTDPSLPAPNSGNSYTCTVSSGSSPLVNAANTTYRSRLAIGGKPATGARDIGACEYP